MVAAYMIQKAGNSSKMYVWRCYFWKNIRIKLFTYTSREQLKHFQRRLWELLLALETTKIVFRCTITGSFNN